MAHQDASPTTDSHQPGARKGEDRAKPLSQRETRMASDATGVNAADSAPIDPRMPSMPPA
ncbi:MAG: hypothetical protein ABI147_11765 [Acidobacteriaceae bacterium]